MTFTIVLKAPFKPRCTWLNRPAAYIFFEPFIWIHSILIFLLVTLLFANAPKSICNVGSVHIIMNRFKRNIRKVTFTPKHYGGKRGEITFQLDTEWFSFICYVFVEKLRELGIFLYFFKAKFSIHQKLLESRVSQE